MVRTRALSKRTVLNSVDTSSCTSSMGLIFGTRSPGFRNFDNVAFNTLVTPLCHAIAHGFLGEGAVNEGGFAVGAADTASFMA